MKNLKQIILTLLSVVCIFSCVSMTAFAAAPEIPELPKEFDNQGYLIFHNGVNTWVLLYDRNSINNASFVYRPYSNGSNTIEITFEHVPLSSGTKLAQNYSLSDGAWTKSGSLNSTGSSSNIFKNTMYLSDDFEMYYSTVDIKATDTSGTALTEPFFERAPLPIPLWAEIAEVVEVNKNPLKMTGAFWTLALCGIGLLALVIGLSLFGKLFHRFQAK